MTRTEIESLKVGDVLERTLDVDGFTLKARPGARYGMKGAVTEISYRGVNVKGRTYVGGYTAFGSNNGAMSFSIAEGDESIRIAPPENAAA